MNKMLITKKKVVETAVLLLAFCIGIYSEVKEVRVGFEEEYLTIKHALEDDQNDPYDLIIYVEIGKYGFGVHGSSLDEGTSVTADHGRKIQIRPLLAVNANSTYYIGDREFKIDENKNLTTTYYISKGHGRKVEENGVKYENEYFITNHLGSHVTTVNEQGIETGDVYEYFAYGKQKITQPSSNVSVTKTFTGKELDRYDEDVALGEDGDGLYYFPTRYYDPDIGMWIGTDPAGEFWNPFSYCGGNPINFIDPTGAAIDPATVNEAQLTTFTEQNYGTPAWDAYERLACQDRVYSWDFVYNTSLVFNEFGGNSTFGFFLSDFTLGWDARLSITRKFGGSSGPFAQGTYTIGTDGQRFLFSTGGKVGIQNGGITVTQSAGYNLTYNKPITVAGADVSAGIYSAGARLNQSSNKVRGAFGVKTPVIPIINIGFGVEVRTPSMN